MGKIAQFYGGYYQASGGIETHITEIIQNLDYEFEVLTDALSSYKMIEKPCSNVTIQRFKPYNYSYNPSKSMMTSKITFPYRVLTDIQRIKNKHKFLRKNSFDLVHFHGSGAGDAVTKLSYLLNSTNIVSKLSDFSDLEPKILTVHGLSSLLTNNPMVKKQEMDFIRQFKSIICVDQKLYDYLNNELKNNAKLWCVPNSVNTNKFKYVPIYSHDKLKVGFIGRLEASRGIALLYDLINNLPSYIDLYVLGAGNAKDIERFKSKVDVSRIHFQENIAYEQIPYFLQQLDILFNPVIAEGISRVTLESMSTGRPVIMLNYGNRYPVIHNKTGYLINYDIRELLNLLEYIYNAPEEMEKIGINAKKEIESKYDSKIVIPKIKDIYEELLNEN